MSLAHAFAKIGIAPSPAREPVPQPQQMAAEPPSRPADYYVHYAAGLLRLGAGDAQSLANRLDRCMDGTGAGRARWEDWVRGRLNQQPQRVARELEALGLHSLTRKGVPTWMGEAASVIDALRGGYAQEWLDQTQADARTASTVTFPDLGADETEDAYRARVLAWADELTRGVLARLCPASYGDAPDVEGAIRQRIEARRRLAREAEERALVQAGEQALTALMSAIAAGESVDDLLRRLEQIPYGAGDARSRAYSAIASSPSAWAEARIVDVGYIPSGAPPQGWSALSLDAVARWAIGPRSSYGHRAPVAGAVTELTKRLGLGSTLPHPDRVLSDAPYLWIRESGLSALDGANVPTKVSDAPSAAGWAEPKGDGAFRWCSPAVFAALTRVLDRARTPGTLDVSRVLDAYQRHPEKRYPCFWWSIWGRSSLTVAVDDSLGHTLDDLALVHAHCPARVPASAHWLHAEVRTTQAGGLRVAACKGAPRAALVTVQGHSQQLSRRSVGSTPHARSDSPALAVTGYAGSAKHSDVRVVACVSEGRPLLLDSGVGYRLGAQPGQVERVPGLAEGRPGEPTPA